MSVVFIPVVTFTEEPRQALESVVESRFALMLGPQSLRHYLDSGVAHLTSETTLHLEGTVSGTFPFFLLTFGFELEFWIPPF